MRHHLGGWGVDKVAMLNALDTVVDTMTDGLDRIRVSSHKGPSIVDALDHRLDLGGCELEMFQLVGWGRHATGTHDLNEVGAAADLFAYSSHAFRDAVAHAAQMVVAVSRRNIQWAHATREDPRGHRIGRRRGQR